MNSRERSIAFAALTITTSLLAASPALAVDWGGYLRAGPGATKKDAARACYALASGAAGLKYRLGNECDFFGEFSLSQTTTTGGVDYKVFAMTNVSNPNASDSGDAKLGMSQMYVEGKGFDIAPNTNFWIGKRFYGRADVHIVDTFFANLSGVGAGADSMDVGIGKLGVAFFRSDDSSTGATTSAPGQQPAHRFNVDLTDIGVNPDGKLRVTLTAIRKNSTLGQNGAGISLQHNQARLFHPNSTNTAWLQYAQGSAGLDGNFGNGLAPSNARSVRFVESVNWQMGAFGGQALFLIAREKVAAPVTNAVSRLDSLTLGGRASYAITHNFKMVGELGYSQSKPEASATQKLAKLTIAPTLSTGPAFWNRPELRLYVTTAKWNSAANAAATGGLTGIGDGATSGTSYGAQAEIWF